MDVLSFIIWCWRSYVFSLSLSVLGIDNIDNSQQGLQVNIPEETSQDNVGNEGNPQPPSYQEAIGSEENKTTDDKE